jgi:hypothetical protein
MIHHPHFSAVADRHRNGLHADRHLGLLGDAKVGDVVDDQCVVRRIDGEQLGTVAGQRQRPDVPALERHE